MKVTDSREKFNQAFETWANQIRYLKGQGFDFLEEELALCRLAFERGMQFGIETLTDKLLHKG